MKRIAPILLLLFTAGTAAGQDDRAAACKTALARYVSALDSGDIDELRELIHVEPRTTAQREGMIAVADCILFQRILEKLMIEKWGAEGSRPVADRMSLTSPDRIAIRTARVELQDDGRALAILGGNIAPITLRRTAGNWRIVLRIVETLYDGINRIPEPGSQKRIDYLRGVARALRRTAVLVREGVLKSPDETHDSLSKSLADAARGRTIIMPDETDPIK